MSTCIEKDATEPEPHNLQLGSFLYIPNLELHVLLQDLVVVESNGGRMSASRLAPLGGERWEASSLLKLFGRVLAAVAQQDLLAARVVVGKGAHVKDLAVDDDPGVLVGLVLGDLCGSVLHGGAVYRSVKSVETLRWPTRA